MMPTRLSSALGLTLLLPLTPLGIGLGARPAHAADAPSASSAAPPPVVIERIVAVVDNSVVLQSEVDSIIEQVERSQPVPEGIDKEALRAERRRQILDTLVAEKLLEAEVRKLRIDVTAAEIDRVLDSTMSENNLTEETFKMALAREGLTVDEYRGQLKKQLTKMKIIQIKVKGRVNVTDNDVTTAEKQAESRDASAGFSKVRASHILFLVPAGTDGQDEMKKALAARVRITQGADFADVAADVSEDPGSKGRGGSLGVFGRGEMVPEFERAAFEAPIGKVVGPVRTSFGWHLLRVDEHVSDAPADPEQARERLRGQIYQSEIEAQFKQYLDELKRDAFIEIRL